MTPVPWHTCGGPSRTRMRRYNIIGAAFALLMAGCGIRAAELTTSAIAGVCVGGTPIEVVREGFEGTEGPLALPDGDLLFVENRASRVTRVAVDGSVSAFVTYPGGVNALAFDPHGELVAVLTAQPGIAVIYPADKARTLVDRVDGKPFNRPNDLVIDRNGGVYFTDPGGYPKPGQPRTPTAVYYLDPGGKLTRLVQDIELPNGIQLSPDERTLYVANTQGEYVLAFDVAADGSVHGRRNFARLAGFRQTPNGPSSGADGLAVDSAGRLYVATTTGVQVFNPRGEALGTIVLPKQPQNLAFAGKHKRALFVVGGGSVYRITMLAQGFRGRAK
jgi:gluconolactonase